MKLRSIAESEYAGLEDADQFGDPLEDLVAFMKIANRMKWMTAGGKKAKLGYGDGSYSRTILPILKRHFTDQQIATARNRVDYSHAGYDLTHNDLDNAYHLISMVPELQEWWSSVADMPERLAPNYGRSDPDLVHLGLNESEYEGLEDADEFGGDIEFMGEGHLGPHIFRVYYHKSGDLVSMEINGYELSPWEDTMPSAQKETIMRDLFRYRPDLVKYVKDHSVNGRIMDIGLALVQN